MIMKCFHCGETLDVATAYMVIPYVGERYGWYCNEDCYKEDDNRTSDAIHSMYKPKRKEDEKV